MASANAAGGGYNTSMLRNLYLYAAIFWLALGIALIFRSWVGWLMLLMGLYTLARWYSLRSAEEQARVAGQLARRRRRRKPVEPDPTFDFDSDPRAP
jgi:protein-S-isoprenylcysteine O-methyltransferase Ste14